MKEPVIFCPQCAYRPVAEDRWHCTPACGTSFHTFWTGGLCPGCGHAWQATQCPACDVFSPHRAWYHWPDAAEGDADGSAAEPRRPVEHAPAAA